MTEFIKVHSYNGELYIVNTNQIVNLYQNKSKESVLVLASIVDGKNIEIIDSIRSIQSYEKLLNVTVDDYGQLG